MNEAHLIRREDYEIIKSRFNGPIRVQSLDALGADILPALVDQSGSSMRLFDSERSTLLEILGEFTVVPPRSFILDDPNDENLRYFYDNPFKISDIDEEEIDVYAFANNADQYFEGLSRLTQPRVYSGVNGIEELPDSYQVRDLLFLYDQALFREESEKSPIALIGFTEILE